MLVLSRRIDQQFVVDDQWIVTVERFDSNALLLSLANHRGVPLGRVTAPLNAPVGLIRDVDLVYVRSEAEKVRLGLESSDGTEIANRLARKEHWDLLRGRSD